MAKIRMGMVGGGEGAFIGTIHRMAAAIDGEIELVCGAFSSDPARSQRSGAALHLPAERVYTDFQTMMTAEAALPPELRMQFVAIVTPNHMHFPVAEAALRAGFHVLSDKPATLNLNEALQLKELVAETGLLYGLTHTYNGYPLVKEARERISRGDLGKVRKVVVEYPQGWLADRQEDTGNKQASWRLDPKQAGISSCMGDIGVHASNLAEYVSGLQISSLCSDLTAFVEGRELDDDGSVLLRFDGGARGVLHASQVCAGEENGLRIRVYGEHGGLEWAQQEPNTLWLKWPDRPTEMLRAGGGYLGALAAANTRTPMGHPEGYLEAFANLYMAFAGQIRASEADIPLDARSADCPGIDEAVRGMTFIELAVAASNSDVKWHPFPKH
ncbi:Gfo/Idh/MocA family protein [Biformimicrobium ophioploci]|uniref:Gfo/Idh/MocA family oxidoreductase n=1 Tax=Biformimicrobium ophioploci TaxID=3036711 RepID=A0ABQ6LZ47_9GAMM|nr:Gfo/Idh/MocA family oxidoreductase [Microbulbifer sp. NKW57]GMG87355.1 Gfo/Idh/MocA family oxidoreductase [Microbulbifer sp. NKW57]